jgi:hypothetical protein
MVNNVLTPQTFAYAGRTTAGPGGWGSRGAILQPDATIGVVGHGHLAPTATDGGRKLLTGTVANTIDDIATVRKTGVTAIALCLRGRDATKSAAI